MSKPDQDDILAQLENLKSDLATWQATVAQRDQALSDLTIERNTIAAEAAQLRGQVSTLTAQNQAQAADLRAKAELIEAHDGQDNDLEAMVAKRVAQLGIVPANAGQASKPKERTPQVNWTERAKAAKAAASSAAK